MPGAVWDRLGSSRYPLLRPEFLAGSVASLLPLSGEFPVEGVGKPLPFLWTEFPGTGGDLPGFPQPLHEIAKGESFPDIIAGVKFTTGVDNDDPHRNENCCQGDILGDDKIAGFGSLSDGVVYHFRPHGDAHGGNIG